MPFMRGPMPLRRTTYYLEQGHILLRDSVRIFSINFHGKPNPLQKGAREFVFWHWAQLQYKNPSVQLVKHNNISVTPFGQAFLVNGDEVLLDFEGKTRQEIHDVIKNVLGKTELVLRREQLEQTLQKNPANFGSEFNRHCLCEVQGQQPCSSVLPVPSYLKGGFRWTKGRP
uniref:Small ribosomal subunit protein mS25 n=1 Tax=Plectus sambesii TaxID=2011161 RepID=A0A914XD09_9BILA